MTNTTDREELIKEIKKVENEYGLWEITTDDQEQGTNVIVRLVSYWSFYDTTPATDEKV